jgi:hypothetical protein
MVLIRGKTWALSIESPSKWKEMREDPDGVRCFGKMGKGVHPKDENILCKGYYFFPFALRTVRLNEKTL